MATTTQTQVQQAEAVERFLDRKFFKLNEELAAVRGRERMSPSTFEEITRLQTLADLQTFEMVVEEGVTDSVGEAGVAWAKQFLANHQNHFNMGAFNSTSPFHNAVAQTEYVTKLEFAQELMREAEAAARL